MTGARVAAGENFNNSEEFALSMALNAVDVLQPSVAKIGGVSAVLTLLNTHARMRTLAYCHTVLLWSRTPCQRPSAQRVAKTRSTGSAMVDV